ncbi:MAG: DUF86 domain-containing protein [Mangrovibacterium sp.]
MKDDLAFIKHILLCIDKILQYTKNMTPQDFNNNELIQDAVIRNIEIIGEATKKDFKGFKIAISRDSMERNVWHAG